MSTSKESEALSLTKAAEYLIEECRMVLPGVQALFGFQLIAVFSERFDRALSALEKDLHLAAIALVMLAIGLLMAPAAHHRLTTPHHVTARFVRLSSRRLLAGLSALMLALAADFYLVARVVTGQPAAGELAALCVGVYALLWFVLPLAARAREAARTGR